MPIVVGCGRSGTTLLRAMLDARVSTLADLSRVPGVGAAKLDRYGEAFLSALKELAREAA